MKMLSLQPAKVSHLNVLHWKKLILNVKEICQNVRLIDYCEK